MTFQKVKNLIKRNGVKVITFVLTFTLLCFSTLSVSAYTWDELTTSWWNSYSQSNYGALCWDNVYNTDYETDVNVNDNGVAFDFYPVDSGLAGPERSVCFITTRVRFYRGGEALSFLSIPLNITAPELSTRLRYEITNAYSVVNYRLLDNDGNSVERELKIQHSGYQNSPLSNGLTPPVNDFDSPTLPGVEGGFLWSPNDRITVDFGRPVLFDMVTTYIEFNYYPYREAVVSPSGNSTPALQVSYQGKGFDYIPSTLEEVRFFGLNEPSISVGDAILNNDTAVEDIQGVFADINILGVVSFFNRLMEVSFIKSLVVIGVSASVIAAILGVASAYSNRKE